MASDMEREDAWLLARAHAAKNGAQFAALWRGDTTGYPSPSEADLALCRRLAWWTGSDAARVDRLFRQSGLLRPKWDEQRGGATYGARTIATAGCGGAPAARRAPDAQRRAARSATHGKESADGE